MNLTRLSLACALTSALAACGGGGGTSSTPPTPVTPNPIGTAGITLSGVASKGLIKDAIVNVYAYDAAGNRASAPVLTSRTSKVDGSYTINLGNRTGLFVVEISADSSTTMEDEYSGTIAMPAGMTLRGVVQLDANSNSTVTGHVTPFTDMLVTAAMSAGANGALTAGNVAAAQADVSKILGFNPLTTKPLNANSDAAATTSDAAEKLQALALAAISGIAHHNGLGCAGTASEKIKCAVNATTGSATMQGGTVSITGAAKDALLTELVTTAQDPNVNKTTIKTMDGQKLFTDVAISTPTPTTPTPTPTTPTPTTPTPTPTTPTPTPTTPTPTTPTPTTPTPTPTPDPVAEAKTFFSSLRTNLQAWSSSNQNGGLRNALDTMQADFDAAVAPLDQSLADWVVVSGRGIQLYDSFAQRKSTDVTVGDINDDNSLGACTLYKDSAATIAMTAGDSGTKPGSVVCVLNKKTIAGSERASAASGVYNRDQVTRTITLLPTGANAFSYTSRTLLETQAYSKDGAGFGYDYVTLNGSSQLGSTASGTVSYTLNGSTVISATINGYMPARVDDNGAALTDREAWNIRYATTTENGGVTRYAFSGKVDAEKNGASLGAVIINDGSYARAALNNGHYRMKDGLLSISVKAGTSTVTGSLALSQFTTDHNGNRYLPTSAKFTGNFTNTKGDSFDGALSLQATNYKNINSAAPQSASNFATGSVSFSGKLKVSGLKPLTVTFALRNTGYKKTEFNGTYSDSVNQIAFSGDNSLPLTVDLSSASGIKLKWVEGAAFLDVFKNSSKVALINVNTHIINYVDGSFETLK